MDRGKAKMGHTSPSKKNGAPANGIELPVKEMRKVVKYSKSDDDVCFLELQEANNIFRAVYKEIMTIAFHANYFVKGIPALGSIEELQNVFHISPPSNMRIETSTGTGILPISASQLCTNLMDVDLWSRSVSHILYNRGCYKETGILKHLKDADPSVQEVEMVNLELQLPTPFGEARRFSFLRFLKEIIRNELWAIVDVSKDYFDHRDVDYMIKGKSRKRPSGIIIRSCDAYSEIIWIENVEMPKQSQFPVDIYSEIIGSEVAFSAQRWVNALAWSLKRTRSTFIVQNIQLGSPCQHALLALTEYMKLDFMECLREFPNERDWLILLDNRFRIMLDTRRASTGRSSPSCYSTVVSFKIRAKPLLVFQYLVKKNLEFQWHSSPNTNGVTEVLRFATDDGSNCITLHERHGGWRCQEYLLQEASWDGFSYIVISTIMSQSEVYSSLLERSDDVYLQPSGFAVMPDGSDASLVTFSSQKELGVSNVNEGITLMNTFTSRIIAEIVEEIADAVNAGSKA